MKAKRLLALVLALCLLVSVVSTGMIMPATAASGTLGEDRITGHDNLRTYVDTTTLGTNADWWWSADKLFDNSLDTRFDANNFEDKGSLWVTFKMTEAKTITAYTLGTFSAGSAGYEPTAWTLYASSDNGVTYDVVLDQVTNHTPSGESAVYYDEDFRVDDPAAYQYYKIEFTAYGGGGYFQVGQLVLSGYDLTAIKAVEEKIDALGEITSLDQESAVVEARAAYDALDVKASVNNVDELNAAEGKIAILKAEDTEKAIAAVDAIAAIGTVTYKSEPAIEAAEAVWNALSETDKATLAASGAILTDARATYEALLNNYSVTFTSDLKTGDIPWSAKFSNEDIAASHDAMADEAKYQYYKGVNIGIQPGETKGTSMWGVGTQVESQPNDNVRNPWWDIGQRRLLTFLVVPFSGMAFTYDAYMSAQYETAIPLGDMFTYNGKNYQVFDRFYKYYDTTPYVNGGEVALTKQTIAPGSGTYAAVIGNVFNYAYADYSQTNKWDDKTLGIPTANAQLGGTATYYQAFEGPNGKAYLIADGADLATVTLATDADGYEAQLSAAADKVTVVTGALADAIAKDESMMNLCGAVVSATANEIVFENGTLTADGFAQTDAQAVARLQGIIDALPAAEDVQAFDKAAVEAARAEYDAATTAVQNQVNADKLTDAEAAIAAIYADAEIAALVNDIHNTQAQLLGSVKAKIEGYRAAYEALSADKQAKVTNLDELEALEADMEQISADFKVTIDAWVANNQTWGESDYTQTPWMNAASSEDMAASAEATGDEIWYQWVENDYSVGFLSNKTFNHWQSVHLEADGSPSDNVGSPWADQTNRKITFLITPYPGIAFSSNGYFPIMRDRDAVFSNPFEYNGRIYQQLNDGIVSYDATVEIVDRNTEVDDKWESIYPGQGLDKNDTFLYAYAKYNQDYKWDGKTVGLADGNVVNVADTNTLYQKFNNADGVVYLLNTDERVAGVTAANNTADYIDQVTANAAYVIDGELGTAFDQNLNKLADAGKLISATDDKLVFANGILTKDGYTAVDTTDLFDFDVNSTRTGDAITWNTEITWNGETYTIGELNDMLTFTEYGVYYGVSDDAVAQAADADGEVKNAEEKTIATKRVFGAAKGETEANVYTIFGFRMLNVKADADRTAQFYIKYKDANGIERISYSDMETVVAAASVE